ncbi:MAG: GDP-mannose 4,6-dehydratase [Legionellaceae bacterium]|nr:GDP-mannose 4,6-dehydratase [Legionellaceae bacterium]
MKKALITGITGQDGSLMAEYLLNKNYTIYGFARHASWLRENLASHLKNEINIIYGDMTNGVDIANAVSTVLPDEIYNLASQSRPSESWDRAPETLLVNGMGAIHLFEAVRLMHPSSKIYHASSSEMFGRTTASPQNEQTAFDPASPYAASKVYAHQMAKIYRESYNLFISNGILFNHESERRPIHFVTQKIAYGAACAALGIKTSPHKNERGEPIVQNGKLALGNLEVSRDWGYAKDFVHGMWQILQYDRPEDFVIGTGNLHSLKELCEIAYQHVGQQWDEHVFSDPAFIRPLDANITVADASKAAKLLDWRPSISFEVMIKKMVDAQIIKLKESQSNTVGPGVITN